MIRILVIAISALLFAGCSTKVEYVYLKPKPFNFQTIQQPKIREIRVHKEDKKLYSAYIGNFRNIIDFYNKQIEDYKKSFDNNDTNTTGE